MRLGSVLRVSNSTTTQGNLSHGIDRSVEVKVKRLIADDSAVATVVTVFFGFADVGATAIGGGAEQFMKWSSLVYRWFWGGIC